METPLLAAFSSLPLDHRETLRTALSTLLARQTESMTIKRARDNFPAVNRRAREGQLQLVGSTPEDQTVIISVEDLATMLQAAARTLSFADVLAQADFRPKRREIELIEGDDQENEFSIHGVSQAARQTP